MTKLKEDFEASGGVWKEWRIGDLFDIHPTKAYKMTNLDLFKNKGDIPVVTNSSVENGITGYVNLKPTEKGGIVTYSDTTTDEGIFYQPYDFVGYSHVQGVYPLKTYNWNEDKLLYFVSLFKKSAKGRFDYASKFNRAIAKEMLVNLPTFNGEPSYFYMEQYISLLEKEKMLQVDKFLKDSGLNDTTLTVEETAALEKFRNGEVKFVERKIGDLFEKVKLGISNPNFNKKTDLSACKDLEHPIPVINAKIGDNGIMYWAKQGDFETISKCIDVIQNGAIATGKVYAQPQETGVLWDSYLIKHVKTTLEDEQLFFFATVIEKSIRLKFYYDCKAYWNEVKEEFIMLPCTLDNDIDYTFMQHFISAWEKLVMRGVVKYKDEMLNAYDKALDFAVAAEQMLNYGQKSEFL
ncbi:MAG: restriction endonuclease subunit S [Salinivirgaceae bacterium]|nr:restriction endonuclease subunit S [Salinivirgaceae bacterium]